MALIILQKSTFPDIRDSAPKVWFGRAACTKPQPHPIPMSFEAGSLRRPCLFCVTAPFSAHTTGQGRGLFYVGPEGACAVWGASAGVCGGGLPIVLALLEHWIRSAGIGAERGRPAPACGAGELLRLRRPAADGAFGAVAGPLLPGGGQLCAALPLRGRRRAGGALPGAERLPALPAGSGAGCEGAGRAVLCCAPAVRRRPAGGASHRLSGRRGPRRGGPRSGAGRHPFHRRAGHPPVRSHGAGTSAAGQ